MSVFVIGGGTGGGGGGGNTFNVTGLAAWNGSDTYSDGDFVYFGGVFYNANQAVAAGESPATHPAKWTQLSSLVSLTKAGHGMTSADHGKPIGWRASANVGVWDNTSGTQLEYPIGVLQRVVDGSTFMYAPPGCALDIPAALISVAGTEPVGAGGSEANSRFLFWSKTSGTYTTELPVDSVVNVEVIYYLCKNANGTHRVLVLGLRPAE